MEQTGVEWLKIQIINTTKRMGLELNIDVYFEEALKMEKEQIKDAFINGANIDSDTYGVDAEQYYSETFKSE